MPAVTVKPSAWDPDGALWCTSLGGQGANDWPNSALYWPGTVTAGWSGSTLSKWTKMSTMLGRAPAGLRDYFYLSDIQNVTTNNGSGGKYGFFSADHVTIMNGGAVLLASFFFSSGAGTDHYTAVTGGSHDADLDLLAQNIYRWSIDTANTAPIKKIILAYHHEPSNDSKTAGSAAQFVAAFRYIVSYMRAHHAAANNCIEWAYIDIATAYNAGNFYPGDDYVTWAFADPYNWGGGLVTPAASQSAGHMPTTGDSVLVVSNGQNTSGHYNDAWRSVRLICQPLLNWADDHPSIRLGLTELGCSQDIRRYTVNGSFNLTTPLTHNGDPTLMTEWVTQSLNAFKGNASDVGTSASNAFAADPRMRRIQIVSWWNSQAQGPRWFNQMPVADGASTPGTSLPGGVTTHSTFDAFVTLVNNAYFTGTANVGPTITDFSVAATDTADQETWSVTVTAGTSTTLTYSLTRGDGTTDSGSLTPVSGSTYSASGTYIYAADGTYRNTITITDGNSLTASIFADVTVSGGTPPPEVTSYLELELWQSGDSVKTHGRLRHNAAENALDLVAQRWTPIVLRDDSTNWTSMPAVITQYQGITNGSRNWYVSFTGMEQVKAAASLNNAGASTARLVPVYSLDGSVWHCFDTAGTSGTVATLGGSGPLTGPVLNIGAVGPTKTGVFDIPTEARTDDVLVTFWGYGGDGSTSPQPNRLSLSAR